MSLLWDFEALILPSEALSLILSLVGVCGDGGGGGGVCVCVCVCVWARRRVCTLEQEYLSTNLTIRLNKHWVWPDQSLDVNTKSKAQSECI